jgi:hypothetical protein
VPKQWKVDTISGRIREGGKDGLLFGLAYSAYALVLYLVRGPELFASHGIGLIELLLLYLAGGAIAGGICGGLEPLTGSLFGRILVGIIAALPFAFLLGWTALPVEDVQQNLVPVAVGCAILWGVMGGAMFWFTRD